MNSVGFFNATCSKRRQVNGIANKPAAAASRADRTGNRNFIRQNAEKSKSGIA